MYSYYSETFFKNLLCPDLILFPNQQYSFT
jgi:hypothetical protein